MAALPNRRSRLPSRRRIGLIAGVAGFALILVLPAPDGMSDAAWRTAAVAVLMAAWWASEAIPIPATALLPLVLFPVLEIATIGDAAKPFANPLIFLFLGGFILALTVQRWDLHRRVAINLLRLFGDKPARIVAGVMVTTAVLSMWLSNTATAMLMLPIAASTVAIVTETGSAGGDLARRQYAPALMLAVAYAANVGGLGTLIGTPANALLAAFISETYGFEIGFGVWMAFGAPLILILLPVIWLVLVKVAFPAVGRMAARHQGDAIAAARRELGGLSSAERRTAAIFVLAAVLWIARPTIERETGFDALGDAGIAVFCALLTFLAPSGRRGASLMDWDHAKTLPWGILVLFGGGLSLAAAVQSSGLAAWIAGGVDAIGATSPVVLTLAVVTVVVLLTELTSNTATAATFLPIAAAVSLSQIGDPLPLSIAVAIAASCAFMLPIATPPNAIVFASDHVTIPQMMRAGLLLNLISILVLSGFALTVAPLVFGGGR